MIRLFRDRVEGSAVELYGFKDENTNRIIIEPKYTDVNLKYGDVIAVKIDGKWGFIDEETGREIIEPKYDNVKSCGHLIGVKIDDKWGLIERSGKEIANPKYERVEWCRNLAGVKLNGKWGVVDETGKEICEFKYDEVFRDIHSKYIRVELNGKLGFIDETGKEVVECKYDVIRDFDEDLIKVGLGRKRGLCDNTGKEIIECKFDDIYSLSGTDLVIVEKNDKYGAIDRTGKTVFECLYSGIEIKNNLIYIKANHKFGIRSNKTGELLIPAEFDRIYSLYDCIAEVKNEGQYGYAVVSGKFYESLTDLCKKLPEKILANDAELSRYKNAILEMIRSDINDANENDEREIRRSTKLANKCIAIITKRKLDYEKAKAKEEAKKEKFEKLKKSAIEDLDALVTDKEEVIEVTND